MLTLLEFAFTSAESASAVSTPITVTAVLFVFALLSLVTVTFYFPDGITNNGGLGNSQCASGQYNHQCNRKIFSIINSFFNLFLYLLDVVNIIESCKETKIFLIFAEINNEKWNYPLLS